MSELALPILGFGDGPTPPRVQWKDGTRGWPLPASWAAHLIPNGKPSKSIKKIYAIEMSSCSMTIAKEILKW